MLQLLELVNMASEHATPAAVFRKACMLYAETAPGLKLRIALSGQRGPCMRAAWLSSPGSPGSLGCRDIADVAVQGDQILPLLFQCLEDDYFEATRSHACAALAATGPHLSSAQAASAFQELLKCLDDSSNGVRVAACAGLRACLGSRSSSRVSFDAALLANLAVHLDDEDAAVQEAMCGVLSACAAQQPELVQAELPAACSQHRSQELMRVILDVASQRQP